MKKSSGILIGMIAVFFISAVIESRFINLFQASYLVSIAVFAFLIFWWVGESAREQNIVVPWGARLFSALFPPLGIPYYFLRGYGLKAGSVKILKSLGFLLILSIVSEIPYHVG